MISGATRLYGVLGDPVAQVAAPGLLNPLLADLGMDAVVLPVHVGAGSFQGVVQALAAVGNLAGLLVTVPHKAAACALAGEVSPLARLSGTANALRRAPGGGWAADNFDGVGFVRGLAAAGHDVAGASVRLVGAGGAGSAIAVALLAAGVARLSVEDVDNARLGPLLTRLNSRWPGRTNNGGYPDIVVNATPLGLRAGDPLPFDLSSVPPDSVVADIVMKPRETALLRAAAAAGHPVHHGFHMLEQQVSYYRDFFGWH